jgi:hypothetical protein
MKVNQLLDEIIFIKVQTTAYLLMGVKIDLDFHHAS